MMVAGFAWLGDARSEATESASEQGEYIAHAAGCMSCHGENLAGG